MQGMLEGRASQISPVTESSQVLFSFKSDMMLEMVLHRQKTALILNEIIKLKLHLSRYYVSQVNKLIADTVKPPKPERTAVIRKIVHFGRSFRFGRIL